MSGLPTVAQWVNQEAARLKKEGWEPGTPRERDLLKWWSQHRPRMLAALREQGIAEKLAMVLERLCYRAEREYIRAGWPPTDAQETAEREWLIKEPEETKERENPLQRLSALISTSPTRPD